MTPVNVKKTFIGESELSGKKTFYSLTLERCFSKIALELKLAACFLFLNKNGLRVVQKFSERASCTTTTAVFFAQDFIARDPLI